MSAGTVALLVAVVVALGFGLTWRMRDGRVRRKRASGTTHSLYERLPEHVRERLPVDADTRVTLLQLSTTFCAPCRHARVLLNDLAQRTDGVRHVEVDLTDHPEWSTPLGVHQTPTTLALDDAGHELFRVLGVPRRDELAAALGTHLGDPK